MHKAVVFFGTMVVLAANLERAFTLFYMLKMVGKRWWG
jgi:hypothetical protein